MALATAARFLINAAPGRTYAVTLRQADLDGTLGDWWNESTGAWVASDPGYAAKKIALVEGTAEDAGEYIATHAAFETYTGGAVYKIHDEGLSNRTVRTEFFDLLLGLPGPGIADLAGSGFNSSTDTLESIYAATALAAGGVVFSDTQYVSPSRTWRILSAADGNEAANVVQETIDVTNTFAFDFGDILNTGTGIATGSVAVETGSDLTFESPVPAGDRRILHVDITADTVGTRALKASVTSTDGQMLSGGATFVVE